MSSRLDALFDELDSHRKVLRKAVDSVPFEQRQRRPAPDRWSVAENLEHLAIVETRLTRLFAARVTTMKTQARQVDSAAPPAGAPGLAGGKTFTTARVVNRTSRFKTNESSEPKGQLDADAAWAQLEQARQELRALLLASDGMPLHEITHPHPFFGPLNMYEWVNFLAGHDARHAEQIREAGEALTP